MLEHTPSEAAVEIRMVRRMATIAERDQVRVVIIAQLTPGSDVMNFEPSAGTAVLTSPLVAPQH